MPASTYEPASFELLITQTAQLICAQFKGRLTDQRIATQIKTAVERAKKRQIPTEELSARLQRWAGEVAEKRQDHRYQTAALRDLQTCLTYTPEADERYRKIARWTFSHWTQATAIAAVGAVAILRVTYTQFFAPLGLSPEEAGYDSARILTGSLPGLLLLIAVTSAVYGIGALPLSLVSAADHEKAIATAQGADRRVIRGKQSRAVVAWFIALSLTIYYLVGYLGFIRGGVARQLERIPLASDVSNVAYGALAGGIAGLIGTCLGYTFRAGLTAVMKARRKSKPYLLFNWKNFVASLVGAVPTIFVLTFILLALIARAEGQRVVSGGTMQPLHVAGLPILDVRAPAVRLAHAPAELDKAACYRLLGQKDGNVLLFQLKNQQVDASLVRVPSGDVVISQPSGQQAC